MKKRILLPFLLAVSAAVSLYFGAVKDADFFTKFFFQNRNVLLLFLVFDEGEEGNFVFFPEVLQEVLGPNLAAGRVRVRQIGGEHENLHCYFANSLTMRSLSVFSITRWRGSARIRFASLSKLTVT